MQNDDIIERLGNLEDIPPLPALASQVINTCFDDLADFHQMADLIKQDPILSARILTLINSPTFALTTEVKDLSHAISLLGKNQVRNLALSVTIFDTFSPAGKKREQEMAAFWQHCVACAYTSEALARKLNYPKPEEAFVAGLLHDIGKLIAYHRLESEFKQFIARLKEFSADDQPQWPQLELEKEILGAPHHLIGKWVTEAWNFPAPIIEAVWLHHQPPVESRQEIPSLPLLVRLADAICNLYNLGSSYFINHELDYSTSTPYAHTVESLKTFFRLDHETLVDIYHTVDNRLHEFGNCLHPVDNELYFAAIHRANKELGRLNLEREKTLAELELKNCLLEGLSAINQRIATRPKRSDLIDEIITQTLRLSRSQMDFTFCGLGPTETSSTTWLGRFGERKFSAKELRKELPISGEADKISKQTRIMAILKRLITKKPTALLRNSRITPLREYPSILIVPICNQQLTINPVIHGQLFIDCQQLERCGVSKTILLEALSRFTSGISELIERYQMSEKLSGQAESITELNRLSEAMYHDLLLSHRLATVGRLAAGAAHEINNPLTVISGQLQILRAKAERNGQTDETNLKRYNSMLGKVDKISRITRDLLAYGRPQMAQTKSISLQSIIEQSIDAVNHRQGFANIGFAINIPDNLPNLMVDPQQLDQIFINLLINAQLAMPEGGSITISATAKPEQRRIKIDFSDTGCGIAPEHLPTIFDPFFTTRGPNKGTGLGLSIAHTLIDANKGTIEVHSILNRGSTFSIFLPMA
ncbi:MAG: HDOD domain-containing protein [Deltaproteobacteria bacterium]|nr:HDOD domain-containing protein [Candidatus Tharpella sp.]